MKSTLLEREERRTGVLTHLGLLSAALTVLVFSALFFTEVSLTVMAGIRFTVELLLLSFASYMMYFSLFEVGMEHATRDARYDEAQKRLRTAAESARRTASLAALRLFCKEFSERESKERRFLLLSSQLLDEEDVKRLTEKPSGTLTRKERRLLSRLTSEVPVHLSPSMLLSDRPFSLLCPPLGRTPQRMRLRRTLLYLLPTALTAFFSVSLACEVIVAPSASDLVGYILKLFTLFYNGAKGYRNGYRHMTEDRLPYMEERAEILEEFLRLTPPSPKET